VVSPDTKEVVVREATAVVKVATAARVATVAKVDTVVSLHTRRTEWAVIWATS
jgi:hypothetical protein